jgi:hypothetical protein
MEILQVRIYKEKIVCAGSCMTVLSVKLSPPCPQLRLLTPTRAIASAVRRFHHLRFKFEYFMSLKFQVSIAVVSTVTIT